MVFYVFQLRRFKGKSYLLFLLFFNLRITTKIHCVTQFQETMTKALKLNTYPMKQQSINFRYGYETL